MRIFINSSIFYKKVCYLVQFELVFRDLEVELL